jgi:transcriptional regulator with GAF, ATPase, and Fis domain
MSEDLDISQITLEMPPESGCVEGALAITLLSPDQIRIQSIRLRFLEEVLNLSATAINFNDFCEHLTLSILKLFGCDSGAFLQLDRENHAYFFRAAVGRSSDVVKQFVIPERKGIVGKAAEQGCVVVVESASENADHLKAIADTVGYEVVNITAIPIVIEGACFGVVELINRRSNETYSTEDIELLQYCANSAVQFIRSWRARDPELK